MKTLLAVLILVAAAGGAAAQQRAPVALPTAADDIVWDGYLQVMLNWCNRGDPLAFDDAANADLSRRILDHMVRLHGTAGGQQLLGGTGVAQRYLGRTLSIATLRDMGREPAGICALHDWREVRARLDAYRADHTLNVPRRR